MVDLSSNAVRHQLARCLLLTAEALIAHGYEPPPATRRRLLPLWALARWTPEMLQAS